VRRDLSGYYHLSGLGTDYHDAGEKFRMLRLGAKIMEQRVELLLLLSPSDGMMNNMPRTFALRRSWRVPMWRGFKWMRRTFVQEGESQAQRLVMHIHRRSPRREWLR